MNLTSTTDQALEAVCELTGYTRTDAINRAIQVYAFVEKAVAAGDQVYIREAASGQITEIHFL